MRRQHRQILVALLEGPLTTIDAPRRAGVLALSQRCGPRELEGMGLVIRGRHKTEGGAEVLMVMLTEKGREVARALAAGVPLPTGAGERQEPHPAADPAPEVCQHKWGTTYPKDGKGGFFITCEKCGADSSEATLFPEPAR